jgi:general L-amino acid transport system substrate-binding protein
MNRSNMKSPFRQLLLATFAMGASAVCIASAQAQTLEAVKARGELICGVSQGLTGFSASDSKGEWSGFDVDYCRALAAAIFNDPKKVRFVGLNAAERFEALRSSKIDVLMRNSTWTMGRETELGLIFAGINYHDGQGFLVSRKRNITSALELTGSKVCVQDGTTSEANAVDFFRANDIKYELVIAKTLEELGNNYDSGKCDALSSDVSQLYSERLSYQRPDDHTILPDVISKEPLGPVVRASDVKWFTIVKWVNFALINAEELGVTSKNIEEAKASRKPDVRRLIGTEGKFGEQMGLDNAWALNAIRAVGNYGEIFERNVGTETKLGIPRGINQLWSMGGILYAPPIR